MGSGAAAAARNAGSAAGAVGSAAGDNMVSRRRNTVQPESATCVAQQTEEKRGSKNKPFIIAGVLIAVIIVGAIAIVVDIRDV